jgi:hypothetical protein
VKVPDEGRSSVAVAIKFSGRGFAELRQLQAFGAKNFHVRGDKVLFFSLWCSYLRGYPFK